MQNATAIRPLLLLAVVAACGAVAPRHARADELPEDTNRIESLTPEQAKKLVATFPGVVITVEGDIDGSMPLPEALPLNGLKTLDAETAAALAAYDKGRLHPLLLDGLTTLSPDAAQALASFTGWRMSLNGLTELSPETAAALAGYRRQRLCLNGATALSVDTGKALARYPGSLFLDGLTTLSEDAAGSLAECDLHGLSLGGYGGKLLLLDGLASLSPDAAGKLAAFKGFWLSLKGLPTLDAATAGELAKFKGQTLRLDGLTHLDADAAQALVQIAAWDGHLPAITALEAPDSVAVAAAIATRQGRLSLPNLARISPQTLSALIVKEDVEIPPVETLELIPEPDGSLTEDVVIPEGFRIRQRARRQAR